MDETGSAVPQARGKASRRCEATAVSMAGLDRKVILRRGPVTIVGRDFVEAAADKAALRP